MLHEHPPCQRSGSKRSHPLHSQAWTSLVPSTSVPLDSLSQTRCGFVYSHYWLLEQYISTSLLTHPLKLSLDAYNDSLQEEDYLKFLSDNAKTFKAAAKFKDESVLNHLAGRGVEWWFNIDKAPWWGGAFERMVKSTKCCLRKMVGRSKLSLLHTAIVEVESIINSRPLSYISSGDLEEPLTPSHLLIGRRVLNLPDNLGVLLSDPEDEEFTVSPNQLGDRVKNVSESLNYFWD